MKVATQTLINQLQDLTSKHKAQLKSLCDLSPDELSAHPADGGWNILECIEHLNRYGRFYLPEIKSRMANSHAVASDNFKSGLLGNYFAESMLPKPGFKKMNTFTSMNPSQMDLDKSVLDEFEKQLNQMQSLLEAACLKNLNSIKTSISISRWIKLKLGDTLRVVIFHNERHMQQVKQITNGLAQLSHSTHS